MPEIALRKAFQAFLFFSPRCTRLNKVFLLGWIETKATQGFKRQTTMPLTSDEQTLWEIFHPYAWEQELRANNEHFRFSHYTRAESALNIIDSKRFWMRKTNCMSDFTEVEHGINCIVNTYNKTKSGIKFQATLNEIFDGFTSRIAPLFNRWIPSIKLDTYIACFSVH
jgi:hypothetical protein